MKQIVVIILVGLFSQMSSAVHSSILHVRQVLNKRACSSSLDPDNYEESFYFTEQQVSVSNIASKDALASALRTKALINSVGQEVENGELATPLVSKEIFAEIKKLNVSLSEFVDVFKRIHKYPRLRENNYYYIGDSYNFDGPEVLVLTVEFFKQYKGNRQNPEAFADSSIEIAGEIEEKLNLSVFKLGAAALRTTADINEKVSYQAIIATELSGYSLDKIEKSELGSWHSSSVNVYGVKLSHLLEIHSLAETKGMDMDKATVIVKAGLRLASDKYFYEGVKFLKNIMRSN